MERECIVGKAPMKTSWKPQTGIQLKLWAAEQERGKPEREPPRRSEAARTADFSKRYKSHSLSID